MEYSNAYLRDVLPAESPSELAVPEPVMQEIFTLLQDGESFDGDDSFVLKRSVMWTYAAFEQMRLGNFELELGSPATERQGGFGKEAGRAHFGLFDPTFEKPGFGLILDADWPVRPPMPQRALAGIIRFPRLGQSFPVIERQMVTILHAQAAPVNSHSACWARDNKAASNWGFITSGHAVAGGSVPLTNGANGIFARSHHPPIDAAFVATAPPARPELRKLANLATLRFPAAGLPVEIETPKGPQLRHVVSVFNSLGVINTTYFGIQLFFDNSCQPGDSGSLVRTLAGDAAALYSGELRGAALNGLTNQILGIGQHFEQALHALNVSAYR